MVNETTFVNDVGTLLDNVDEIQNETVIQSNDITSSEESETETFEDSVEILEAKIDITTILYQYFAVVWVIILVIVLIIQIFTMQILIQVKRGMILHDTICEIIIDV